MKEVVMNQPRKRKKKITVKLGRPKKKLPVVVTDKLFSSVLIGTIRQLTNDLVNWNVKIERVQAEAKVMDQRLAVLRELANVYEDAAKLAQLREDTAKLAQGR